MVRGRPSLLLPTLPSSFLALFLRRANRFKYDIVLAYQHFLLGRLLLTAFDPRAWRPSFESLRSLQQAHVGAHNASEIATPLQNAKSQLLSQERAASDFRTLLGLSMSNPTVTTASLTAHHALHTCALRHHSSRPPTQLIGPSSLIILYRWLTVAERARAVRGYRIPSADC